MKMNENTACLKILNFLKEWFNKYKENFIYRKRLLEVEFELNEIENQLKNGTISAEMIKLFFERYSFKLNDEEIICDKTYRKDDNEIYIEYHFKNGNEFYVAPLKSVIEEKLFHENFKFYEK